MNEAVKLPFVLYDRMVEGLETQICSAHAPINHWDLHHCSHAVLCCDVLSQWYPLQKAMIGRGTMRCELIGPIWAIRGRTVWQGVPLRAVLEAEAEVETEGL